MIKKVPVVGGGVAGFGHDRRAVTSRLHVPFDNVNQCAAIKGHVFDDLLAHCFKRQLQHVGKVIGKPVSKPYEVRVPCVGVVLNELCGHRRVDGKALKEGWPALAQNAVSSLRANERVGQRKGRLLIHQLFGSARG